MLVEAYYINADLHSLSKKQQKNTINVDHLTTIRRSMEGYTNKNTHDRILDISCYGNNSKFSRKLYNIMLTDSGSGRNYKWLNYIKNILISVGKPDLINQPFINNPQASKNSKIIK